MRMRHHGPVAADPVLDDAQLAAALAERPTWSVVDGVEGPSTLHRELAFRDFAQAFGFMAQVALAAEKLDHHPDWSNSWNKVVIDITNHASGGLTARCFELAAAVDGAADGAG
jgi:4a-hydroxytetrahydrobiopterin dehydratase